MEIQWSLVLFTALSGVGAFVFAFTCLEDLLKHELGKLAYINSAIAVVLMGIGGIASATHIIHHLDRIMAVLTHPAQGIFLEALMLGITCVIAVVYVVLRYRGVNDTAVHIVAVLGIIASVLFSFFCGFSYMMGSRPSWNVILLPIGYTGTVIAGGAGIVLAMAARSCDASMLKSTSTYTIAGGIIALLTGGAYGIYSGAAFGEYAWVFWVLVVLVDGIVPIVCGLLAKKDANRAFSAGIIAAVAGCVGSSGYRVLMWLIGVAIANYFGMVI